MFLRLCLAALMFQQACTPTSSKPDIVVSFDINKTIIASDLVQGKTVEQTVNAILAEFTRADWDSNGNNQSYYARLTNEITAEHPALSRASEEFKRLRDDRLKSFEYYLRQHPNQQLLAQYSQDKQRMTEILGAHELTLFPSFVKAIGWLAQEYPDNHTIYLRTFGKDLPEIMPHTQEVTGIKFSGSGEFSNGQLSLVPHGTSLIDFLREPHHKHYGIRDDYTRWKAAGFTAQGGKPFVIDENNPDVVYIFFDDNANDPDKPILNPIDSDGQALDTQKLLISGHIVAVNPKEAILDEDYFINHLKRICRYRIQNS